MGHGSIRELKAALLAATCIGLPMQAHAETAGAAGNVQSTQSAGSTAEQPVFDDLNGRAASRGNSGTQVEEIVVTGSRVITNGNNSPTPLTTISTKTLEATTPSNIPDGLNKLPVFVGSRSQRTTGGATINWPGNYLNLRSLGTNRTLILSDGMRVPWTDSSGNVDVNIFPDGLIERVDIVTGGASAVYGSDAITGVVNFVINNRFNGLTAKVQAGASSRGDNKNWRASIAGGMDLSERAHVVASYEHYESDGINSLMARPYGAGVYQQSGSGTAASPYIIVGDNRNPAMSPGGYIASGALANMQFSANGVLSPFTHGAAVPSNYERGGDGGYMGYGHVLFPGVNNNPWLLASLKSDRAFGRFDYDLGGIKWFAQLSVGHNENFNASNEKGLTSQPFSVDNPFLPASARTLLANAGQGTFNLSKTFYDRTGNISHGVTTNLIFNTGFKGTFADRYNWQVSYTNGQATLHEKIPNKFDGQKLQAALDVISSPATGLPVCRASLGARAAQYADCVPFNAFGPSAESDAAWNYVTKDLDYRTTNRMQDVAGSISGPVIEGWAGPIVVALSGEYRDMSLETKSRYQPTEMIDCTGIAVCKAGTRWVDVLASLPKVSERVAEAAIEANVPLLKDLPLVKSLSVNGAARYTDYSVSGIARPWKLGAIWEVDDNLKFRATRSVDIRAPNLSDLFASVNSNPFAGYDPLTNKAGVFTIIFGGNPNLKPEKGHTYTLGAVYTPPFVPGLSLSFDWYDIKIDNAIQSIYGLDPTVVQLCVQSGGTSSYCLADRPNPITDTSAANFPTGLHYVPLNVGEVNTHGFDAELNYRLDVDRLSTNLGGQLDFRVFWSYQPKITRTTGIPGGVIVNTAGTAGFASQRVYVTASYTKGPLTINVADRWHNAEKQNGNPTLVYGYPKIPSYNVTDLSLSYRFKAAGHRFESFVSIENLFDKKPDLFTTTSGSPGYAYPAPADQDVVGRFFTTGLRARF
jgi:iron complex outermembrane receptor protein